MRLAKLNFKKILGLVAIVMLASFFVNDIAVAFSPNGNRLAILQSDESTIIEKGSQKNTEAIEQKKQQAMQKKKELKAKLATKKQEHRQKICAKIGQHAERRYAVIGKHLDNINDRLTHRVQKAKDFVEKNNLNVENYDTLLADITTKKQAAQNTTIAVKESASGFDCNNENAKSQAQQIKGKVVEFKNAAVAYKSSVRTLLKAVKSAAQNQPQGESVSQNSGGGQ